MGKRKMIIILLAIAAIAAPNVYNIIHYSQPVTEIVVDKYIRAFDYEPATKTIYYFGTEKDKRFDREDGIQFIKSYNLSTKQESIIDKDFPYNTLPWLGVGKQGEIYVLDSSRGEWSPNSMQERFLLVYRDGHLSDRYSLSYIYDNEWTQYFSMDDSIAFLGLAFDDDHNIYPKFVIAQDQKNGKVAYDMKWCDKAVFKNNLDVLIDNNLQNIYRETYIDTLNRPRYIWVNESYNFRYREKTKYTLGGIFGNSPCERVYDFVRLNDKNYKMGSCFWSIWDFPSSGNFFNNDGNLIFNSFGIHILK